MPARARRLGNQAAAHRCHRHLGPLLRPALRRRKNLSALYTLPQIAAPEEPAHMDFQPAYSATDDVNVALIEESQRTFMNRVYRWMFGGLLTTAFTAVGTVSNAALLNFTLQNYFFLIIASFGFVLALSFFAQRMSGAVAGTMFLLYSMLVGMTLTPIFFAFKLGSVGQAFFITAGVFGAMSIYGT